MENSTQPLSRKEIKDLGVLLKFTSVYCKVKHDASKSIVSSDEPEIQRLPLGRFPVCDECRKFLLYAFDRRLRCPLEEKPVCKHCPVHCYKSEYRDKVREVMRFSGAYLIRRGRLDLLWHYFF